MENVLKNKKSLRLINEKIEDLVQSFLDEGIDPSTLARIFATHSVQINLVSYKTNETNNISDKDFRNLLANIFEGIGMPFFHITNQEDYQKCANDNQKIANIVPINPKKLN